MSEQADLNQDKKSAGENEVALELMKFIAVTTGYGKGTGTAGFQGKQSRTAEEYAESLLGLYVRCKHVVSKGL